MSWRSLAGALLLISVGWLFVYGAPMHDELTVLGGADGYRDAELLVTHPMCAVSAPGGQSSGNWCSLAGTVAGAHVELSTGPSLPVEHPAGSRVRVLFNPALPAVGWNHQTLRVLRWEEDIAAASRRRVIGMVGWLAASVLLAVCALLAVRRGTRHLVRARGAAFLPPPTETGRVSLLVFLVIVIGTPWMAWRAWQDPDVRARVALTAVAPLGGLLPFETMPGLRVWAARELARRQTTPTLLALIRLLNTMDPGRDPVFATKIMDALRAVSGGSGESGEWGVQLAGGNRWVAARVGRSLDIHSGVLGWFAVAPEFQRVIDAMAGPDPQVAWHAWSTFGAGTLTTSEAFLFAVGSALSDPRPITFVIRRTSAAGTPLAVEGGPQPPTGKVQARTVGEALALRLWQYQDVSSAGATEDFDLWWSGYAKRRLLPPLALPALP